MNPRVVIVTRPSQLEGLLAKYATKAQVRFFLESRGQSLDRLEHQQDMQQRALRSVLQAVPSEWRQTQVSRAELDRFIFSPDDLVAIVGQDGLVANVAKYLGAQPVIGINPDASEYEGILVKHAAKDSAELFASVATNRLSFEKRTMVQASLDDGQQLLALNEVFVGHKSHQTARYTLNFNGQAERQFSSGLIVASGTGATGWAKSIYRQRQCDFGLPQPSDETLAFFVREAFPSPFTGVALTQNLCHSDAPLGITSHMDRGGVIFGDGIEQDRLEFGWGQRVTVLPAKEKLHLVV